MCGTTSSISSSRSTLDLLRKSLAKTKFKVVDAGDKVKAKTEAFTATTVTFGKNAEDFEPADNAFDMETQAGQGAVGSFLFIAQRMMLGCFSGQEAMGV